MKNLGTVVAVVLGLVVLPAVAFFAWTKVQAANKAEQAAQAAAAAEAQAATANQRQGGGGGTSVGGVVGGIVGGAVNLLGGLFGL